MKVVLLTLFTIIALVKISYCDIDDIEIANELAHCFDKSKFKTEKNQ